MIDAEAVRARALGAASRGASALTIDVLREALVVIDPATRRWEGSGGEHVAHRVTLRLPAATLARVNADHGARDELTRAIAVAIADAERESLDHLEIRWSRSESARSAYRGAAPEEVTAVAALRAYLGAIGEGDLAAAVDGVDETSAGVRVRVVGFEPDRPRLGEHARALFGPGIAITVTPPG